MADLGYTTIGATTNSLPADILYGDGPFLMIENGTLTTMSVHWDTSLSATLRLAIYEDSAGSPGAFVDITDEIAGGAGTTSGWHSGNVQHAAALTSGTSYWLFIWTFSGLNILHDTWPDYSTHRSQYAYPTTYSSTGDSPALLPSFNYANVKLSLYATYEAAGSQNIVSAVSTDTAYALTGSNHIAIGPAGETSTAQALAVTFGTASTAAAGLVYLWGDQNFNVAGVANPATETDSARPLSYRKLLSVGVALETDQARNVRIFAQQQVDVIRAVETDQAMPLVFSQRVHLVPLDETDLTLVPLPEADLTLVPLPEADLTLVPLN